MSIAERVQERWLAHGLYAQETSAASGTVEVANWGWFPALSLVNAVSLLLFAVANRIGYGASAWAGPLFWVALAGLLIPNALRLIAVDTTRRERMALVLGLGMTLYLFKVVHSPFAFTYSDEFAHLFNASRILKYHGLFTENSGLPASAYFPGLASVTAALATFTGLSIFHAGLIVIGGARLVLLLGLYLLMEQVSRSARVAALATAIYMCHSSFLFWSSQFAYESLALPLMVGVFFVIAR
ncbi:MAG: hypothetical protein KDE31_34835, partial [Caldilineaceae bacterium]|nr:hypothetical protein [Caldilineaceae bacterium]